VAVNGFDLSPWQMLLEGRGVVDEVGFSEAHGDNSTAYDCSPQATRYCFDFGKFRHKGPQTK
jgi:hypothetical protein